MSPNDFPELNINFLSHPDLAKLVARDYDELRKLIPSNTPKSVLVLSGSIIEGALSDALISSAEHTVKTVNKLSFEEIIDAAKELGVIRKTDLSTVLRAYRNLVHPAREVIDHVEIDGADAMLARSAVDVVLKELRTWSAFSKAIKQISENEATLLALFGTLPPTDSEYEHGWLTCNLNSAIPSLTERGLIDSEGQMTGPTGRITCRVTVASKAKRYLEALYFKGPVTRESVNINLRNVASLGASGSGATGSSY